MLPLRLDRLNPQIFITFANAIDPFVDRIYGPNFNPHDPDDAALIREIARFDEAAIDAGALTPTHLVGVFGHEPVDCRFPRRRSPARAVHDPMSEPSTVRASRSKPEAAEQVDEDALEGWKRYHALRARKAVRLALAVAQARHRRTRS